MDAILFFWSKGAETRRKILRKVGECERSGEPCYLNMLADALKLSHVAVKKHVDLMIENGYLRVLNPNGRPAFLSLTKKGKSVLSKLLS